MSLTRQSWRVCQSELRDVLLSHAYKPAVCYRLLSETLIYLSFKLLFDVSSNLPQPTRK